jgi:SecD/SecF fusion protein
MKRETRLRSIVLIAILALCAISLWPTFLVFSKNNDHSIPLDQREREIYKKDHPKIAAKALNLGLDLAGGTHIIVEIDRSKLDESSGHDVLDRTLEIIRNRVDQYGLSEPVITKSGNNRIIADLAGMGAEDARRLIGATALLEFKLVPEVQEFKPVLDRLDAFLAVRSKGLTPEQAAAGKPAKARSETENVFGRVVGDDKASAISVKDTTATASTSTDSTAAAATDTAIAGFDPDNRPFTSLLMQVGRDIGVASENVEKMRRILADKEVQQIIPARYQFLWSREEEALQGGQKVRRLYMLKRRAEMTGATIADANFQHAQGGLNSGELEVGLTFKDLGPKEFARITGANVGKQLAIVLDSVVYSAPVIQGRIPNGRASITGVGNVTEAKQLAVVLRAGALPVPMNIVELRSVGPTLGEENIRKGIIAAVISMILILLFIAVYYRTAGIISNIALTVNMIMTIGILGAFHATLTLPGIAGLALTLGMAVDANILIMERIREELAAGRSLRASIDAGYQKAFRAILDSNITVLGTAAILYYVGVGSIKGFGLTLLLGVGASMFTAVFVTRLLFDFMLKNPERKTIAIGQTWGFLKNVNMQVIPKAKIYAGISIAAILISAGALVFKGPTLGVDFTGGNVFQVKSETALDINKVRTDLEAVGVSPKVQTLGGSAGKEVLIYTTTTGNDSALRATVTQTLGAGVQIVGEETVGPTIGNDLKKSAVISVLLALLLVVLYIWFRFGVNGLGFGLAAVIALAHDAIVTLGVFTIMGWELNLPFVAAILTIIGYSVNDTIVIFDRVREITADNTSKASFAARVDQANNESFSRTIVIAFLVTLSIVVLVAFGGSSIRDMNVALLIGSIAGTFSTIALACPFVVWWNNRRIRAPKAS